MPTFIRILITLLIGIVIYAGLPLAGWGVADIRGFFADPARLIYIVLAVILTLVAGIRMPAVGKPRVKAKTTVNRQRMAVVLMQIISLSLVIAAPFCDRRGIAVFGGSEIVRWPGLVIFTIGFIVMLWSQMHLGKQFSVQVSIQEGHKLITDGPYRYIRHPRYLGIILFCIGFSLIFRSWAALVLTAAMSLVLIWRIYDEEVLLSKEFGPEWEDYKRRSCRLIPFVY